MRKKLRKEKKGNWVRKNNVNSKKGGKRREMEMRVYVETLRGK